MVVDDEAGIREVICLALESGGHDCLTAADGGEALALVSAHGSEVCGVITDLHMPEMNGVELIRHLRETRPELPIMVSSGSISSEDRLTLAELGVVDVLPKPYTAKELLRHVESMICGGYCVRH